VQEEAARMGRAPRATKQGRVMQGAGLVLTSYQDSLERAMSIVANNVANVSTTGYKRENVAFDTYLMEPTPKDSFAFAVDNGTYRDTAQGATTMTGNPLDLAIQGPGYFPVQTKSGVRYTRGGAFQLDPQGNLVTAAGDKVLGDGGQALNFPDDARDIYIAGDGTVSAVDSTNAKIDIGRLKPAEFANEQSLAPEGDNLFTATTPPASDAKEIGSIVQGAVEDSNVKPVEEMTRMIAVSRSYQLVAKLVEKDNQRQLDAIQRLGKVTS